jgi:aldose 1-epimerase
MRTARALALILASTAVAIGCSGGESSGPVQQPHPRLTQSYWGQTADGTVVDLITLRNMNDIEVRIATYGGTILSLRTPDRTGLVDDIVLGFDTLEPYFDQSPYFGSLIGRFGNRIAGGRFALDGVDYELAINNDPNHLHGGNRGWDKVVWSSEPFQDLTGVGVILRYVSADGEEGYPGQVTAEVVYTLTDDDQLIVDYRATTDKPTVINLTQHSYFNLAGGAASDILGHELTINASQFTPVDETLIPTGELASVEGTAFDFRQPTAIGARIEQDDEQLAHGLGYDHNFVLNRTGEGLQAAARVYDPITGRVLEVATTEPGLQFYSGNFLDGTITGKGGGTYAHRSGFCLETQHFPDSPNQPTFPSTVLRPGEEYRSQTVFTFGRQ